MNLFINPNQRGFELPKGCKDLIDVIRQPELMQPFAKAKLEGFHAPDYPQRGGFGRIKVYIARLFTPAGRGRMLAIGCDEPRILIWLMYRGEAFNPRLCLTYTGLEQAKAVRTVFSEKAVLPILDSSVTSDGVSLRLLHFPLPRCAVEATRVTTELLRRGFSLPDDATFWFYLT